MGKFDGILIASDFDGTVAVDGIVSPENRRAIDYFMENGGMFTLATGRAPAFIGNIGINMNILEIDPKMNKDNKAQNQMKIEDVLLQVVMLNPLKKHLSLMI